MDSRRVRILATIVLLTAALGACGGKQAPKPAGPVTLPGDQALFDQGTQALEKKDWERGRTLLQQLVDSYPQSSLAPKARIAIADSHFAQNDEIHRAQATVEYQAFISLYPFSESAAYAQFQLGMIKFRRIRIASRDLTEARDAMKEFGKVVSEYPNSSYAEQAREKIKECRARLAEHELVIAEFYLKQKSYEAALTRLKTLLNEFPEFPEAGRVYYRMGECAEKLGKRDDAITYYQKAADATSSGEYGPRAKEKLKELEHAS